jgi:hypothetical protein
MAAMLEIVVMVGNELCDRAGRWHRVLHHLVPGILLILLSGYLGVELAPTAPRDVFAVMFGIGETLTLDEFALWLPLKDVY